jgi:hypothetical protein
LSFLAHYLLAIWFVIALVEDTHDVSHHLSTFAVDAAAVNLANDIGWIINQ